MFRAAIKTLLFTLLVGLLTNCTAHFLTTFAIDPPDSSDFAAVAMSSSASSPSHSFGSILRQSSARSSSDGIEK